MAGIGIPHDRVGAIIVPRYLTARDYVWLDALLEEYRRFVGARRSEVRARLREPLSTPAPPAQLRAAIRVLDRLYTDRTASRVAPRTVRRVVFAAAARENVRERALATAAAELRCEGDREELVEWLFADLPSERRLVPLSNSLSAAELAVRTNHAIATSLLKRAVRVTIRAEGELRPLVRAAKLRGLIVAAKQIAGSRGVALEISGPYALFRHTLVYGNALASLVPRVARCHQFELRAVCALSGNTDLVEFVIRSGDPVIPATDVKPFDSRVEERFARDFAKIAPDWDVIREPEAVSLGSQWMFPDFLLRHRRAPERRFLLEIVGFWTREYLEHKLAQLHAARLERCILCVDETRNCSESLFPDNARVIFYKRRVPAEAVLRAVTQTSLGDSTP